MPTRHSGSAIDGQQLALPLAPLKNSDFLSNHWLDHRLPLEPEWQDAREAATTALRKLQDLWRIQKDRVSLYGDEAGLEEKFIQPVLECLGWHLKYQTLLDRREPDYALYLSDNDLHASLKAGRANPSFWSHATLVADAKAWHVSLDRPTRIGSSREYPPEQIEWYLNHSLRDFGILTNGRYWRLIPRVLGAGKARFETYLELDFPYLMDLLTPKGSELALDVLGPAFDQFLRFFLLFSPTGFASVEGKKPLITRALEGSSEYSVGVSEELKERVFEALRLCVEGFIKHAPNGLDPAADLEECRQHSLILLYRLLFVFYAEDRGLLPYRVNQTYTSNRSLARHRDEIASRLAQVEQGFSSQEYSATQTTLWQDLQDLFDLIDRGHQRYGVQAYNGGLFDLEADSFLSKNILPDQYLARVVDQLGRAPLPGNPELGLFRVDYRDLAIQQLGSVYEGLLELKPRYATEMMRVVRQPAGAPHEDLVLRAAAPVPKGFQPTGVVYSAESIYLATEKGERRRSASYYTPDHIVDHIVQSTLAPCCSDVFAVLREEIEKAAAALEVATDPDARALIKNELTSLQGDYDRRILKLNILDPAMGSGHFLIRACQYLAEDIATNPYTSDSNDHSSDGDEPTITYWKRKVAETCLHGVDNNPMAVELAKLALWLETASADAPLTFLDHHLMCGDSLIGARIPRLDSMSGNAGLLAGIFNREIADALPQLVGPLVEIREMPSDTAEHVKEKETLYRRRFQPQLARFKLIADLWVSEALGDRSVRPEDYSSLLSHLSSPKKFSEAAAAEWVNRALSFLKEKSVSPFHWELEYPDVFLLPISHKPGFDVIIGNPPYEVLAEKEIGRNVDHLKRFCADDPTLQGARGGKTNLFKLFVARSLELLADGGRFSFIVPMAMLGDEQSSGIRHMLFEQGEFSETHAFPQKDNPNLRVFPDAKLSTALFVYRKTSMTRRVNAQFRSYVHPAQFIEDSEPLLLDGETVKIYDPENLTIVSCTQADWSLMASLDPRKIERLGRYAEFFQGEVNQTIATGKGWLTTADRGKLVKRGANICLYQMRSASQGEDIFVNVEAFLADKDQETKAFHHRFERVALQESSPQNNFRRIIACKAAVGEFFNHTVNYTTAKHSSLDLHLVLFILNSAFSEWYFRLGSTNAHVSQYQLKNLPCPRFVDTDGREADTERLISAMLRRSDFDALEASCLKLASDGCSPASQTAIATVVEYICAEEHARGEIARSDRSNLSPRAEACQVILDKTLLILLGIGLDRYNFVRDRLANML